MLFEWFNTNRYIIFALLLINLVVFAMYGIDKWKAVNHKWRIPEATLIGGAVVGVIGALLGMKVFHHKTKKLKFYVTVPLILVVEVVSVIYWVYRF